MPEKYPRPPFSSFRASHWKNNQFFRENGNEYGIRFFEAGGGESSEPLSMNTQPSVSAIKLHHSHWLQS